MAAVTQTIPNFLGGVSNQPDDKKKPGQVTEALNAYPDPTFGLTKRPGFKFIAELADGITTGGSDFDATDLDNAKWFYYNRDADEKYIGCIVGKSTSSYGEIHVWNTVLDDAVVTTVDTIVAGDTYAVGAAGTYLNTTSDGSGTGLTIRITSISGGGATGPITGVEVIDGGKGYAVDETITIPGGNGAGRIDVATISNGVFKKCHMTYGTNARYYLGKKETADAVASTNASDYDFLTIRDNTIITNKNRVVTAQSTPSFTANEKATIRIHLVEYSSEYSVTLIKGGTTYKATCKTRAGDTATDDADNTYFLRANDILTDLKSGSSTGDNEYAHTNAASGLHGISGITATIIGTTLELEGNSAFTVDVTGGKSGTALSSYQDTVDLISELPNSTKHDRVVTINNTASAYDTYYAKFVANDTTNSGPGVWEETRAPNVSPGLTNSTLPHKLYNNVRNHFTFEQISYTNRLVGDDTTNEHPSFFHADGKTIQQAFYYNNRLGFLTEDNVSMSKSDDFFNFYMTSAQITTDADPIDISCSSVRPALLHGIIPSAGGLLLFSQNQQFVMFSADGNLSPKTALIRGLSNYKMETDIDPVDVGNNINFVSKTHDTAGYTRVFGFQPQGIGQLPRVVDIARAVSEYIPATITSLTASPQNSFIAMYGSTLDKIYFYRTYSDGDQDLMQTWFSWECPGNVHYVTVDSDTMFSIIKTGSSTTARYNLCSATMTQTPEEEIIVTAEGLQVNPHMDFYKVTDAVNQFPIESVTITAGGSGYSGTPTVAIAAPASGTQATGTAVMDSGAVASITITNPGKGYDPVNPPAVTFSGGGGSAAAGTAVVYDGSYCQMPFSNITSLEPVIVISGNASDDWAGTTESGFTITPERTTVNSVNYYSVPRKDLSASAAKLFLGYKYNYDITLPKLYFQKSPDGTQSDYTSNLTISRMKFSIGKSSVVGFKLKRKGVQSDTQTFTADGSTTAFSPDFKIIDKSDIIVKRNGAKQTLVTAYSGDSDDQKSQYILTDHSTLEDQVTATFGTAPAKTTFADAFTGSTKIGTGYSNGSNIATTGGSGTGLTVDVTTSTGKISACTVNKSGTGYKVNDVITVDAGGKNAQLRITTLPDTVEIYTEQWYTLEPTQNANYYLADDVPLDTQSTFVVPIHQRSANYTLRVFSNSPFPVSLTSATWEGVYSPRYYRRL